MLLQVKDLNIEFHTQEETIYAVNGIDFSVIPGETLGIVGESGSGKSVATQAILQLTPCPPGKIKKGSINFKENDLLTLSDEEMNQIRGQDISMIFQEPMTSLNPVYTVENQISEILKLHSPHYKNIDDSDKVLSLLKAVGIPSPESRLKCYPHELSGGMRQRVMIAMAIACNPSLLIADEPTTALDVTIQAQILDLMVDLNKKTGTAIVLITHDLGVIAEMAQWVAVMYAGRVVEQTNVDILFEEPLHPYTRGLIGSIPVLGELKERLDVIPGNVPNLVDLPQGCTFASRCEARVEHGLDICRKKMPDLITYKKGHEVRCWLYQDHGDHKAPMI